MGGEGSGSKMRTKDFIKESFISCEVWNAALNNSMSIFPRARSSPSRRRGRSLRLAGKFFQEHQSCKQNGGQQRPTKVDFFQELAALSKFSRERGAFLCARRVAPRLDEIAFPRVFVCLLEKLKCCSRRAKDLPLF